MKVTADMTIGELIRLDENIIPILMRSWYALHWMPFRTGRKSCRGSYGSRN